VNNLDIEAVAVEVPDKAEGAGVRGINAGAFNFPLPPSPSPSLAGEGCSSNIFLNETTVNLAGHPSDEEELDIEASSSTGGVIGRW